MFFRSYCVAIALLIMAAVVPNSAYADEDHYSKANKTGNTYASIILKKGASVDMQQQKVLKSLLSIIQFESNVDVVTMHVLTVADGRVLKSTSSAPLSARKRTGRVKSHLKNTLEKEGVFQTLTVQGFATSKIDIGLTNESGIEAMARQAFQSIDQSNGVFIVTTWDDMVKGDQSRGLVGFGSFN